MTTYITKKQRLFQEDLRDIALPARPHSKLKAYSSVTDSRAWAAHTADKNDYLLDIIKRNDKCHNLIPTEVMNDILVAYKNDEIDALKQKIKELNRLVAAYDSLDLTPEQRAFIDGVKGRIANPDIDWNDDDSARSGYGTARSGPSSSQLDPLSKEIPDTLSKEKLKDYLMNKDKDITEIHRQVHVIYTAIVRDCGLREYIPCPPEIPDDLAIFEKILQKMHVIRTFINGVAGGELIDHQEATTSSMEGLEYCVPDITLISGGSGVPIVCPGIEGHSEYELSSDDEGLKPNTLKIGMPEMNYSFIARLKAQNKMLENERNRLKDRLHKVEAAAFHPREDDLDQLDLLLLENEKLRLDLNELQDAYDDVDIQYQQAKGEQALMQIKLDEVYALEDEVKRLKKGNADKTNFLNSQSNKMDSIKVEKDDLECKCAALRNICDEYLHLKEKVETDNANGKEELEALKATIAKQKCIISDSEDEIKRLLNEMDTLLVQRETEPGQTDHLIAELALKEKQLLENDLQLKELDNLKQDIAELKGLLDFADTEKQRLSSEIKDKDKMLQNTESRFRNVEDEMKTKLESEKAANDNLKLQGSDLLKQIQGLNKLRRKSEENANIAEKQNNNMRVESKKLLDQISTLRDKEKSYENLKITHECMCLEKELLEGEVISKIVEASKTQGALSLTEKQNELLLQRIEELENQTMELRNKLDDLSESAPSPEILDSLKQEVEALKAAALLASNEAERKLQEKEKSERLKKKKEDAKEYRKDESETSQSDTEREEQKDKEKLLKEQEPDIAHCLRECEEKKEEFLRRAEKEKFSLLQKAEKEKEGKLWKARLSEKSFIDAELEKLGNMEEVKKEFVVKDNKIKLMSDHIDDLRKEIERLQEEMEKCLVATRESQGLANELGHNLNMVINDLKNENKYLLEEMALMQAKLQDSLEASQLSAAKAAQLSEGRDRVQNDLNTLEQNLMDIQARKPIPGMDTTSVSDMIKRATDAAEMEEKKAKDLKNELDKSNSELKNVLKANRKLMDDYEDIKKELEIIKNENESLKKDLLLANDLAKEALHHSRSKEKELMSAEEKINLLDKEQRSSKDELKTLKAFNNAMEHEKDNMASDKTQMYDDLERAKRKANEAAKDIQDLQNDNKELHSQIDKLKQLLKDANDTIYREHDELQSRLSDILKENDRIKLANKNLESEILDTNKNLAGAKNKVTDARNAKDSYETELRKLKGKFDDLESLNKQLAQDKISLENNIDDMKAVFKEAQDKYQKVLEQKDSQRVELDKTRKQLANADLITDKLEKENDALDGKINNLRNTVNTYESNYKNAQKNNQDLKGDLDQLRKEMELLKSANNDVEKKAEDPKNAPNAQQLRDRPKHEEELDDLRSQLDKAQARLAEMNSLYKNLEENQNKLEKQAIYADNAKRKLQKQVAILKGDASKEDEIKKLTDRLQQAEQQKNKYANDLKEYKKTADSKQPDLAKTESDCAEKLAALKAQYDANIKQMKKEQDEGVQRLQQLHDEAIKDIKRKYENEVENLHKQLEGKGITSKTIPEKDNTQEKKDKKGKIGICKCTLDDAFGIPCSGMGDKTSDPLDIEDLYVKEISYKILNIGLNALSKQELTFIHRKTCRSIKNRNAKKLKGQALNLKIQTLESSLIQKQQLTQQRMVQLERTVQQERQHLEEARAASLVLGSGKLRSSPRGHDDTRSSLAKEMCKNSDLRGLIAYEKKHNQHLQTLLDCQETCRKETPAKPEEDQI